MSFFDKIIHQLFPKSAQTPSKTNQPMISEALKRKNAERKKYFEWQNSGLYKSLWQKFHVAYQTRLRNEMGTWEIHLLQMPAANGIALSFPTNLTAQEFQHIFDLLKDKVLALNYKLVNADRQLYDRKTYVEMKEKYYLKPNIDFQQANELYDQLYGNILIEFYQIDHQPSYLKFVANIYSDRLYTKALSFDELMKHVFEVSD